MFQTIGMPSCQDGFYSYAVLWYFYYKGYDIKDTKIKKEKKKMESDEGSDEDENKSENNNNKNGIKLDEDEENI